jgi:predicted nucleotidyltransferase
MSGSHAEREIKPTAGSRATPRLPSPADLTPLQRAIILTLLYSDLFDYPLTAAEIRRYLPADCPPSDAWDRALTPLIGQWVTRADDYFVLAGRGSIVETRRERHAQGARLWRWAERYAAWMGRVPFVRMVGVCGSLAAGNATADADVDVFIITAKNRLWTVQVWAMTLRRLASCVGVRVCPNYFLTLDSSGQARGGSMQAACDRRSNAARHTDRQETSSFLGGRRCWRSDRAPSQDY